METVVFILLGVVVGGAIGIKIAGFEPWKGAVASICGATLVLLLGAMFALDNWVLDIVIFMVGAGVVGGAMKLPTRALRSIVLGAILLGSIVAGMAGKL
jgi:hypothetical protein